MSSRQTLRRAGRRSRRHRVLLPCIVWRSRDDMLVSRVAMELSATGMQVLTDERILTGEPLRIVICLPETQRWLTVDGHVARVLHGRRPGESGRRLGIDLEGLAQGDLDKLAESSRRLEMHVV